MNFKKICVLVASAFFGVSAFASGFGLYEPSAKSHAFGGATIGKAVDASANFSNPATLTDLTNIEITVGFVTEHPRGKVSVNGDEKNMDPGMFWLPHCMIAVPLPWDFSFGLGMSAEYGLGTEYSKSWPMNWSCYETTVQGFVINPNLAYKITDKWSVGAGLRWLYFDFEQYKNMDLDASGAHVPGYLGHVNYRLKGDNGWDGLGWQVGTKYDILDNLSVGIVYKAAIDTTIKGHTRATGQDTIGSKLAPYMTGDADADITLPQSVTFGVNWDPADDWHLGCAVSWTEWSEFDELVFNIPSPSNNGKKTASPVKLNWRDTWRGSFGVAYDFADDWTVMLSYTYDMDCTDSHQESAMLPPASRHIVAGGFSWDIGWGFEATLSYSCIFMNGFDMHTTDSKGDGSEYTLKTKRGFCHAGGFSLTYRF